MSLEANQKLPLVSIVIPVYNGGQYMREAIDSALGQTYPNCEVIVVNDGSRDDGQTEEIALSYGDRIRYFSKPNGGCGSALNVGIANMRGDFFSWLSHDDAYVPHKIAHQIALHQNSERPDAIVFCGYELMDATSKRTGDMRPHAVLKKNQLETPMLPLLRGLIHGCALLIPRKYFDEMGSFNEALPTTQDYDLWFKFFREAPLIYDEQLLVRSRVHPAQDTHRKWHQHIAECNELWTGFLHKLTDEEMTRMEGSPYRFFSRTAKFLAETPYSEAKKKADELAAERLSKTKISIIMPFRDRFPWAIEAMQSVQSQTHINWELIMVDDGSSTPCIELGEAAEADSRIRYVLQPPKGPAAARNNGIRHATGEYIAFLDSDDLYEPQKLETQLQFMEENLCLLSHTSYQRMTTEGELLEVIHSAKLNGNIFPAVIGTCTIAMPTVMGKKEVFQSLSFPENNEIGEDVCLWIELSAIHRWGGLDTSLTRVRISDQSSAFNPQKQVVGLLNIALYCMRHEHLAAHPTWINRLVTAASRILETPLTNAATDSRPPVEAPNPVEHTTDNIETDIRLDKNHPLDVIYRIPEKVSKELGRAVRKIRKAVSG
ncbi:MAG: glycosyltransferase family 2 protein [Pirellula sp.]|jgi:glycosyltransferase involved in cell wall biosynthesis